MIGNHRNTLSKIFLELSVVACISFGNMFKGNKVIAPRISKIFVPITPPQNLLAVQLEKKPACFKKYFRKAIEHFLHVYIASSKLLGIWENSRTFYKPSTCALRLNNYLELSQPLTCLDDAS